jgi:hypothetical protein
MLRNRLGRRGFVGATMGTAFAGGASHQAFAQQPEQSGAYRETLQTPIVGRLSGRRRRRGTKWRHRRRGSRPQRGECLAH